MLGKGSFFTVGVMGVVAVLIVGGAISASVSLVSGILSAMELLLVLVSSESLTELFPRGLTRGFLSRLHFFNTGSRYFFRCSPENSKGKESAILVLSLYATYNLQPL